MISFLNVKNEPTAVPVPSEPFIHTDSSQPHGAILLRMLTNTASRPESPGEAIAGDNNDLPLEFDIDAIDWHNFMKFT